MRVGGGFGMYKDATGLTSVPTLAQVLSAGNSTGATDISVDSGQNIQWNNSGNIGRIIEGTFTANRTYTLPDATGTFALASTVLNLGNSNLIQSVAGTRSYTLAGSLVTDLVVFNNSSPNAVFTITGNGTVWANGAGFISTNSAYSEFALDKNTSGSLNSAYGYETLTDITTNSGCTAIGARALKTHISASSTAVGAGAVQNVITGGGIVAIGRDAGRYITGGATQQSVATNSIYIGYNAKAKASGLSNEIVIGYDATGNGSNTVTIGNSSITDNYFVGNLQLNSNIVYTGVGTKLITLGGNLNTDKLVIEALNNTAYASFAGDGTIILGKNTSTEPTLIVDRGASTLAMLRGGTNMSLAFFSSTDAVLNVVKGLDVIAGSTADSKIRFRNGQGGSMSLYYGGLQFSSTVNTYGAATRFISISNGTAPTVDYTDTHSYYSSDIAGGDASPHWRNELGDIMKLYKNTALTVSDGTLANAVTRIAELEIVLQNLGVLA